jgi:hypothetical protein
MPSIKEKLKSLLEEIQGIFAEDDEVIVETYTDPKTGITIIFESSYRQLK